VNRPRIERDQAYFVASGQQRTEVDLDRLIDPRFADHVLQVFGAYPRRAARTALRARRSRR
jgi:hypothetical protein